jgi:hypothetical protein
VATLKEAWLDRRASHQRVPDVTTNVNDFGDQADAYAELEADVPIRIEQPDQIELDRGPADVIFWDAWVLPTIANAPKAYDRFVLSDRTLNVEKVEDLTMLDGTLDHYLLRCSEVKVA